MKTLRRLYRDKSPEWMQQNLAGLANLDAEIEPVMPTPWGCVRAYRCDGGDLFVTDTVDVFRTDAGEEYRLE